jgi:hypothetical protein
MSRLVFAALILAVVWRLPAASAAGPYDDLLKYVPPQTNTLLLVNVKAAFDSPLAKREKWSANAYQRYKSGLGFLPPDASQVVISSQVNLSNMTRDHQIGLVRVTTFPTTKSLADREGGSPDSIAGQGVVLSPRNVYFTSLPGPAVASVFPADRQAASRWIRHATKSRGLVLEPFLKKAAEAAGDSVMTIAVDLTDSIDPHLMQKALAISPTVASQKVADVPRLARFVASVQGLTVTAKVSDGITASARLDFGLEITAHKKMARDLFLDMLNDQGVAIPGIEKWTATYTNNSMTLTGPLSTTDLRRILSLFSFPGLSPENAKGGTEKYTGPATQRYMAAVDAVLSGISGKKDSPNYTKTATWYEKAAAQIDQLSRRFVDPIAVDAASRSAKRLRAIGASLRGVPVDLKFLDSQAYDNPTTSVGVSVNLWGGGLRPVVMGGYDDTNYPEIQAAMAKTIADSAKTRFEISSEISNFIATAKQKLSDKYQMPF